MKLKNKKTGEIINSDELLTDKFILDLFSRDFDYFNSKLHKIQDECEDYEEPKNQYYLDCDGRIFEHNTTEYIKNKMKQIGNYFETKEEAEKAVEKLKAIKILKDNGFRFIQWEFDMRTIADGKIWFDVGVNTQWDAEQLLKHKPEVKESLDLLFGGEE